MEMYDSCYGGPCCTCVRCRMRREVEEERQRAAVVAAYCSRLAMPQCIMEPTDPLRDALIDIAHDCGTLEAAQRRAREALKQRPDKWDTHDPNTRNRY